jgi:hypothetical protein
MKNIAIHYISKIITSSKFYSANPVNDVNLLYPDFFSILKIAMNEFKQRYDYEVAIVETYRSNTLQQIYFNSGASKIKRDGMHHYGIAADLAFKRNGKITYQGNYEYLRELLKKNKLHLLGAWDLGHVQFIPVSEQSNLRNTIYEQIKLFQKTNGLKIDGNETIKKAKEIYL